MTTLAPTPTPQARSNGLGIAGFVCALVGAFFSWVPVFGLLLAILGVVLSAVGFTRARRHGADYRGLSLTGIIIGGFATVLALIVTIGTVAVAGKVASDIDHAQAGGNPNAIFMQDRALPPTLAADVRVNGCTVDNTLGVAFLHANLDVRNSAPTTSTYSVTVAALDTTGARVGQAFAIVNSLPAHQTSHIEDATGTANASVPTGAITCQAVGISRLPW